jgi:hypothetical protein
VRLDFEIKMKLAQTILSELADGGLTVAPACAGARALARFNVHSPTTQEMSAPFSIRTLKRRERRAPAVAPASWSAPVLWRFSRAGRKAAEGCRSPKPRGISGAAFV